MRLILRNKQDAGSALCICPLTQAARSDGGTYEGFVQANRNESNDDRTLGIQIVGLYPNMPGSSISPVVFTCLFNGCTQMSSSDKPISSLVPRPATDQHAWISLLCIGSSDRLGARKTSEFHELLVRREMPLR